MDELDNLISDLNDDSAVRSATIELEASVSVSHSPTRDSRLDSLIDGLKLEQSKAKGLTDAQSSVTPRSAVQIKSNSSNMVVPQAIKNQQESTASKGFTGNNSTSTLKPRDSNLQSGYNKAHVNLEQLLQSLPISTTAAKANDSKRNSSTVNAICEYCNEIVVQGESYILALGRLFHTEHFKCRQCSNLIDNNLYYERNNGIVCQKCFNDDRLALQQEDGLVCAYCNQSIKGTCISALGKSWHTEHFFCSQCGVPFEPDQPFLDHDGKAYCDEDYYNMFAPKCGKCDKPVRDNIINGLGKTFHEECFTCEEPGCTVMFAESGNFFEHGGKAYCETHFNAIRGNFCAQCNQPITGRCVTALGKRFHGEHFQCCNCKKLLATGANDSLAIASTFKARDSKPYCTACYIRLFS